MLKVGATPTLNVVWNIRKRIFYNIGIRMKSTGRLFVLGVALVFGPCVLAHPVHVFAHKAKKSAVLTRGSSICINSDRK